MNSTTLVRLEDVEEMIKEKIGRVHPTYTKPILRELLSSLSLLPTQNEWIPVSEKYKLKIYESIIGCDNVNSFLCEFVDGKFCYPISGTCDEYIEILGVTHFMYLPKPANYYEPPMM